MFEPIGFVKSDVTGKVDYNWGNIVSGIVVNVELQSGLKGLETFSHVIIIYHLHEAKFIKEKHLIKRPQERKDMPEVGIFAQRAKDRPNEIGIASVKLLSVNKNVVTVQGLDAINETPVFDIKPYYPQYDLKENATTPVWVNMLMEKYF